MKRTIALALCAALALSCLISTAGAEKTITANPDKVVATPASTANNPVIEGEDPITGLPAGDEPYTPILVAMDNSETAFPHWGVGSASVMVMVPNQSMGNCKMLALFTSEFPELAGGTRSARMTSLYFATVFNAAFVAAGGPPIDAGNSTAASVHYWRQKWGIKSKNASNPEDRKWFDALDGSKLYERTKLVSPPRNLLVHVDKVRDNLISNNVPFEKRPFLFTDEPLARGDEASTVRVDFSHQASNCTFYYKEDLGGYVRESLMGKKDDELELKYNYDRITEEVLVFSNVIILRANFLYDSSIGISYPYVQDHFVGGGQADIFQSGRYIEGSWYREDVTGRLIILDEEGNELQFQRGKSFFILNNEKLAVSCE